MPEAPLPAAPPLALPVSGMTCAACAGRVERALLRVPGVTEARVNLASDIASVAGTAPLPALLAAVEGAGYAVPLVRTELAVGGMTCATCALRLERALGAVPGVVEVAVSLASETAQIGMLAGTPDAALAEAVARAGYAVRAARTATDAAPDATGRERWDLILAALLTAPFLLGMLGMAFGRHWMPPPWVQFALALPVQFWLGRRFYQAGWAALRAGTGNMDLLVALGTSAAFLLSTWSLLAHGAVAAHGHLYFEASAAVIFFVLFGKWLEARARRATGAAIRALLDLRPQTAHRLDPAGGELEVPAIALRPGERIVIRPGERIAADGLVEAGESGVDESALTGESRPVEKRPGAKVATGTIALDGRLIIAVTAVGTETVLARVAALVAAAQASRAPVQRLVDRVSAVFVPLVVGLALLTMLGWLLAGAGLEAAIMHAVAVLVVACPCALGLATPAAIMAGTGAAARAGILLRDAEAIERAGAITLVAFDKTGTLTEGRPAVALAAPAAGLDAAELLRLAGALQQGSEHPLARAVLAAAGPALPPLAEFRALPGRGVEGQVAGRALRLGSPRLLAESGLDPGPLAAQAAAETAAGRSVAWLLEAAPQPRVLGLLAFEDQPKPGAAAAIAALRALGVKAAVLSGDGAAAVTRLATSLGISEVAAEVLPAEKAARVAAWQRAGMRVAMVGDGVNDAPALAAADLGIAMGTGTDVAIQAAAITLLRGDPALVPVALEATRRTLAKIRQNLAWAFGYNLLGLPLAALGLLTPALAGAAMALSSVSVLANALLLARWHPRPPGAKEL